MRFFAEIGKTGLTNAAMGGIIYLAFAGVAHLVERDLAKVEVASSSLVARSKKEVTTYVVTSFLDSSRKLKCSGEVNSPSAKVLLRKTLVRRKSVVFCFGRPNRYGTSELGVLFFIRTFPVND